MAEQNDSFMDRLTSFFRLHDVGAGGQAPGRAAKPRRGQFQNAPPAPFRDRAAFEAGLDRNRAPEAAPTRPQPQAPRLPEPTRLAPPPTPPAPGQLRRPLKKRRPLTRINGSGIREQR